MFISGLRSFRLAASDNNHHSADSSVANRVISELKRLIERGDLKPGSRLPSERKLAIKLKISRPSLRAGLRSLAAMGLLRSRRGSGTYIAQDPQILDGQALNMMAALHGFTHSEMFEARQILETHLAGMAAERATQEQLTLLSEEIASMYASQEDPQEYLVHDVRFHRIIAGACGNSLLASVMDMVAGALYESRRQTVEDTQVLKQATAMHRRIYQAIRSRDAAESRAAMSSHLLASQRSEEQEAERRKSVRPKGTRRPQRSAG
jgi:GntR family transcriptional repressor for pyruvate dehydrogenase complex